MSHKVSRRELKDVIARQAVELHHLRGIREYCEELARERNEAQAKLLGLDGPGPHTDRTQALIDCRATRDQLVSKCTLLEHKYAALVERISRAREHRISMDTFDVEWLDSCIREVEDLYGRPGVKVVGGMVEIPDDPR